MGQAPRESFVGPVANHRVHSWGGGDNEHDRYHAAESTTED